MIQAPNRTTSRSPSEVDVGISARIKRRRTELRLTTDNIGSAIGCSQQQYTRFENGANRIPAGKLVAIAAALETNIALLAPAQTQQDRDLQQIISDFLQLSEGNRRAFKNSLKAAVAAQNTYQSPMR